jgi:hypothetical protein
MEEKVLRLMAQLGLLAVVIWVIAAAMGRRSDSPDPRKRSWQQRRSRGVWAPSVVAAPMAQSAATVPVPIGPMTTY